MKKAILSTIVLVLLAGSYLLYYNFYILPKDMEKYEDYVKKRFYKDKDKKLNQNTYQKKEQVEKDLWQTRGDQRLHSMLKSDSATVEYKVVDGHMQIREDLSQIVSYIQEKLESDDDSELSQRVRILKADSGSYFYKSHQFLSDKVFLTLYKLPSWELPHDEPIKAPYLDGSAKNVVVSFLKRDGVFEAKNFTAEVQSKQPKFVK